MNNNDKHKLFVRLAIICGVIALIFIIICFSIKNYSAQMILGLISGLLIALTFIFFIIVNIYPLEKEKQTKTNNDYSRLNIPLCKNLQQNIIDNYCVIDIETTGLSRTNDQIIEISALRVRNNEITDTFTQLVKPTIPIPASATYINGITNQIIKNALTIKEVLSAFLEFVGSDTVIGHNIERFDLEFIQRDCKKELGKSFTNEYIDTYPLARQTFFNVTNYKLPTLCRELSITPSTHRAEADCISTKELYDKIKQAEKTLGE